MKRICAWHSRNFGFELTMEQGTEPATHGICPDCSAVELAKVNTQRLDSNEQFGEPYSPGSVPLNLDPVAENLDTSPSKVGKNFGISAQRDARLDAFELDELMGHDDPMPHLEHQPD